MNGREEVEYSLGFDELAVEDLPVLANLYDGECLFIVVNQE